MAPLGKFKDDVFKVLRKARSISEGEAAALYRNQEGLIKELTEKLISQSEQLERLKSRTTLLESRLRLAIYGLPDTKEFRSKLVSSELIWDQPPVRYSHFTPEASLNRYRKRFEKLLGAKPQADCFDLNYLPELHSSALRSYLGKTGSYEAVFPSDSPAEQTHLTTLIRTTAISALLATKDGKFDLVVAIQLLETLTPEERPVALKEAFRSLKPGGSLYCELPNLSNRSVNSDLYWAQSRNIRMFSLKQLIQNLEDLRPEKIKCGIWKSDDVEVTEAEYNERGCPPSDSEFLESYILITR
jgi:hypothetical protein